MSPAARSILVFGVYAIALGSVLLVAPNLLLTTFGFPATTEVWIRVLGLVAAILGGYYVAAARSELTAFFRATVWGRGALLLGSIALVAIGRARTMLIVFGLIDACGASWTWMSLKKNQEGPWSEPTA